MRADYVNRVAARLRVRRADLMEKDLVLHQTLSDLADDRFFSRNFVFKGGTCLMKCYLGYLRFSEDIDFTWKDQSAFRGKTGKQTSRILSKTVDETGKLFEGIAKKRGFDFRCEKHDRRYVELGGSNRMCTFKIWYRSDILKRESFFKVQINFVEELCSKRFRTAKLESMFPSRDEELESLFEEHAEYSKPVRLPVYGIKEILSEKIRALLTRRGIKARDFLDAYLIQKKQGFRPADVEKCVIRKTNHALRMYERYRRNLKEKTGLIEKGRIFEWEQERDLLLSELDEKDFNAFISEFTEYLRGLVKKLDASGKT